MDEDGFIRITDRMSRFSKIGGEMVPHIKIEDKLHEIVGAAEQTFAVTSVPDDKKGERLMVLHTLPEDKLRPAWSNLANRTCQRCGSPAGISSSAWKFFPISAQESSTCAA